MTPLLVLTLLAAQNGPDAPAAYTPQPGDIVLFRFDNALWRGAYSACFCGGVTHASVVVARPEGGVALLETMPGRPVSLLEFGPRTLSYPGDVYVRRRATPLTPGQSASLTAFAAAQLGKPYHLLGMLRPPLGPPLRRFGLPCLIDRASMDRPRWICSSLVARACIAAGLICPGALNPEGLCPADLADDRWLDLSGGWAKPARLQWPGRLTAPAASPPARR